MTKITLVPIDIAQEQAGGAALGLAQDLAKLQGGKLVLLNVVEQMPGYIVSQLPVGFHEESLGEADEKLREIAGRHGLAETAEVVIREGRPSTEILEYATEIGADLIVIASHDPGLADFFLGSVAARVVRHAHCSVMVVRKPEG